MDDMVSRQAAISLQPKPKEDRYFQTQNLDDAYDYGWRDLQGCIEKMPPAQPEQAVKGCRNCKYGKYNDYWKTHFCYNPNECTDWNLWEPNVQPKRKTGKWILVKEYIKIAAYKCSECGRSVWDDKGYDVVKDYPYCHCGADMRGEQDE